MKTLTPATTVWTRDGAAVEKRDIWTAMKRGFFGRCPCCGEGKLFRAFLKANDHCSACGKYFTAQRADDLPAYLVIVIVGHVVVPTALWIETNYSPAVWLQLAIYLPVTFLSSLLLLQPVKGAVIGLQWALRMHGFDENETGDIAPGYLNRTQQNSLGMEMAEAAAVASNQIQEGKEADHHPYFRPKDAATLILIDRSGAKPKVLVGRRHDKVVFMPGKYVFPGGRVDKADNRVPVAAPISKELEANLLKGSPKITAGRARALASAAIREACEETGLCLGRKPDKPVKLDGPWKPFADAGLLPDPSGLFLIARAITPPGRVRRFDTRFFTADASTIAHRIEGVVHADAELVELVWVEIGSEPLADAHAMTKNVLAELDHRLATGPLRHDAPVPFFHFYGGKMHKDVLGA